MMKKSLTLRFTKIKICLITLFLIICFTLLYSTIITTQFSYSPSSITSSTSSLYTSVNADNNNNKLSSFIEEKEEGEKYLAYLPHSGLSNQRIELANALLLAYMLKRTLIIPPAFLGTVFGWMPRDQLADHLEWLTTPKNFNKICQRPTPGRLASYIQRSKCEEYRHFGMIHWEELHDFEPLKQAGIKIKFQNIVSLKQMKKDLNIKKNSDIYLHQDVQLYDWRLYENKTEAIGLLRNRLNYFDSFSGRRYYKVLLSRHFERRREKLLYLGGIFGSTRFTIIDPDHKAMQQKIAQVLHYRLDTPLGETVQSIVNYLGGKGTFMGLHFRTGDSPFKKEIAQNLDSFVKNMTEIVGSSQENDEHVDECLNVSYSSSRDTLVVTEEQQQQQEVLKEEEQNDENSLLATLGNRVKVYIATDHKDPRGEKSELLPWFGEFPCTTTLGDLPEHLFRPLDKLRDLESPSKSLRKYLIPIVDAMVAAHARRILTTPRSTFSKYIEELNKAWI